MKSFTLPSPAKLNLSLQVIDKRPDGYHTLKTLFERIDLADELRFLPDRSGKIRVFCAHPQIPNGPKNLVVRAARLLQEHCGVRQGIRIWLKKNIPVAAGLAGGSSNAATVLLGLNRAWQLKLPLGRLIELGSDLGSDVPFFLHNCSWGLGFERGDRIKPVFIRSKLWHVLVVPRLKMYSREVFTRLNLKLTNKDYNVNILIRSLKYNNIRKIGSLLSNDLESSILSINPALGNVKRRLGMYSLAGVSFSGSGPAVFGIAHTKNEAFAVQQKLKQRYARTFVVRTL